LVSDRAVKLAFKGLEGTKKIQTRSGWVFCLQLTRQGLAERQNRSEYHERRPGFKPGFFVSEKTVKLALKSLEETKKHRRETGGSSFGN